MRSIVATDKGESIGLTDRFCIGHSHTSLWRTAHHEAFEKRLLRSPDGAVASIVNNKELDVPTIVDERLQLLDVGLQRSVSSYCNDIETRIGGCRAKTCRQCVAHFSQRARVDVALTPLGAESLPKNRVRLARVGEDRFSAVEQIAEDIDKLVEICRIVFAAKVMRFLADAVLLLPRLAGSDPLLRRRAGIGRRLIQEPRKIV